MDSWFVLLSVSAVAFWGPIHFARSHTIVSTKVRSEIGCMGIAENIIVVNGPVREQHLCGSPFNYVFFGVTQRCGSVVDELQSDAMFFLRCDAKVRLSAPVMDYFGLFYSSESWWAGKQLATGTHVTGGCHAKILEYVSPIQRVLIEINRFSVDYWDANKLAGIDVRYHWQYRPANR